MKDIIYCKHGHIRSAHPNCFITGAGKPDWYDSAKAASRIGFLDIETTGRDAMFSTMLSWSIKPYNKDPVFMVTDKKHLHSDDEDKHLLQPLVSEMLKYDLLVGYYSTWFDMPFIRTRCLEQGLPFPAWGATSHLDMYRVVKRNLRIDRRSLEIVSHIWGYQDKTHIVPKVWRMAGRGRTDALKYVIDHNIADTVLLEKVFLKLEPYFHSTRSSI